MAEQVKPDEQLRLMVAGDLHTLFITDERLMEMTDEQLGKVLRVFSDAVIRRKRHLGEEL